MYSQERLDGHPSRDKSGWAEIQWTLGFLFKDLNPCIQVSRWLHGGPKHSDQRPMTGFWVESQPEDRFLSTSSAAVNSVSDRSDLLAVVKPREPQSGGWRAGGLVSRSRDLLYGAQIHPCVWVCVCFLSRTVTKEVQSESHIENTSLCSSKKENKIFLSLLKMSERKEKSQNSVSEM